MTEEDQTVLMIRGAIASMPANEQEQVRQAYSAIKALEEKFPDYAQVAIALRGAEMAAAA